MTNKLSQSLLKASFPNSGKITSESTRLPRIIQFGTGMLLRALPDFLIQEAIDQGRLNGSVVIVKSTGADVSEFSNQDNLYTVLIKGLRNGQQVQEHKIISCVSSVVSAVDNWSVVLQYAAQPAVDILISNSTEAGFIYKPEIFDEQAAPSTFPAKLTRYLYERFRLLGEMDAPGLIILPTELISENGLVLRSFVERHAEHNLLPELFINWLRIKNYFCNTLVDRIVPGKCEPNDVIQINGVSYTDKLHTAAEPYALWAIEGDEAIKEKLSFFSEGSAAFVTNNLEPYKERKLRILNGSNTFMAGLGWQMDCTTTYDTMMLDQTRIYTRQLIFEEIIPTIEKRCADLETFANETLDRFSNPEIRYPLQTIARGYSGKMNNRNVETFFRYYEIKGQLPVLSCLGLASFFVYYIPAGCDNGVYYMMRDGVKYNYHDDKAELLCSLLSGVSSNPEMLKEKIQEILKNNSIFSRDLTTLPGLLDVVARFASQILETGMPRVLRGVLSK